MSYSFRQGIHSLYILCVVMLLMAVGTNPASAAEIHPFILYTAADIGHITDQLSAEPYAAWLNGETQEAETILAADVSWELDDVPPATEAYYAKVLAFVYAFGGDAFEIRDQCAREAALSLYHIPSNNYKNRFDSDLDISEAVLFWAEAYDFLKGAGYGFDIEGYDNVESTIRGRMKSLRDYMARDTYSLFPSNPTIANDFPSAGDWGDSRMDNHHVKLASSLAVLSLVILDESGSSDDLDHAVGNLRTSLDNMTITGEGGDIAGGWAEGPLYHQYSAHQYLAAATALANTEVTDLYEDCPALVQTHLLLPWMVMPDGYIPPFDDNEAVIFDLAGLLYSHHAELPERDMLLWMWNAAGRPVNKAFRADYIALFDDTPPVYDSPVDYGLNPTGFHPESGFARFGSSWDNDAVYGFLLSEHGEARRDGQAHEHPDGNSVILHAFGEMLLLDSGYGGWSAHDATRYAANHNTILVNGEGPSAASQNSPFNYWDANGADASIVESFSSTAVDYAVSETFFGNTFHSRYVVFPGKRYFFLYDTLTSGSEAAYTLLLHGNGGGTSGGDFTLLEDGGLWEQGGAILRSYTVGSSPDLDFQTETMQHAVYARSPMLTHTVLKAGQTGETASYLTLLYPFRAGDTPPEMESVTVTGGAGIRIAAADTTEYGAILTEGEEMTLVDGDAAFATDAGFLHAVTETDETHRIIFLNGSYIVSHGDTIVKASRPVTLTMSYPDDDTIEGYVLTDDETELTFFDVDASDVVHAGETTPYSTIENNLVFSINGDGDFVITRAPTAIILEPPGNILVEDVPDDNGHALRISWSLSPSEDEGTVDLYRIYRSRNGDFADPAPLSSFTSVDDLLSWEEHAAVLIDSVAAGGTEYFDGAVPLIGADYHYWIEAAGDEGASEKVHSGIVTIVHTLPAGISIEPPYPNPFNASTSIRFNLDREQRVFCAVYDIQGRIVDVLVDGFLSAGTREVIWNGKSAEGRITASGIYFYRFSAGRYLRTGKLLYLK